MADSDPKSPRSEAIEAFDRNIGAAIAIARETDLTTAEAVGTLVIRVFCMVADMLGTDLDELAAPVKEED